MNLANLFKIALKALGNNKFRGFLTMLGIIIGVAAVITMLAIGQGSKKSIQAQISEMGSNMIMIHPGGERRGGVRLSADDMETLKIEDLEDIRSQASFVTYVSPAVNSSGQAIYGANNTLLRQCMGSTGITWRYAAIGSRMEKRLRTGTYRRPQKYASSANP